MSVKRIHDQMGVGQDCCVSGRHPNLGSDEPGVYLGPNPEAPATGLFLAHYIAQEVAICLGYPTLEVYEQQKSLIDSQAMEVAELERRLDEEIHSLQLKAVSTEIKNTKKELLNALEGTTSAIRARLGNSRSDVGAPEGAVDAGAGASSL